MNLFKVTEENFKFNRIILVALMLVLFDGFIVGGPGIGFLVSFFAVMLSIGFGIWHYSKDKKISGLYLKKAGIYLAAFFFIVVIFKGNSYVGKSNARAIIEAVGQYQVKNNAYPETLDELVPMYLKSLPVCAFRLNNRSYHYFYDDKIRVLTWEEAPPFGRRTYNFIKDEWGYVD